MTDEGRGPATSGEMLELSIRQAMAGVSGMNWSRLARESGVSRGTMYRWFSDQQKPTTWTLGRIAKVLDVPVGDLWAAWDQRAPVPTSTEAAIHELVLRLEKQDERFAQLLSRLEVLANGAILAGVTRALTEATPESIDTPPPPRQRRTKRPQE